MSRQTNAEMDQVYRQSWAINKLLCRVAGPKEVGDHIGMATNKVKRYMVRIGKFDMGHNTRQGLETRI